MQVVSRLAFHPPTAACRPADKCNQLRPSSSIPVRSGRPCGATFLQQVVAATSAAVVSRTAQISTVLQVHSIPSHPRGRPAGNLFNRACRRGRKCQRNGVGGQGKSTNKRSRSRNVAKSTRRRLQNRWMKNIFFRSGLLCIFISSNRYCGWWELKSGTIPL